MLANFIVGIFLLIVVQCEKLISVGIFKSFDVLGILLVNGCEFDGLNKHVILSEVV